ncbi:MAG: imidazole glycerol phosphate synthase subunit HisH [Hydrogenophaga sp.]|uniref:imidazole glycerol phosphate synthase subunit HisH n=1 Tax=Hydrogenophaga sp. TaxID=1904254 RepID=UPI002632A782|nr:imidazole glycerol phosphate synthase subunit HisH [Hydrogenophaga sp.]MDM7943743.1 imidazole glycerol phosphate synthase subunit HisH [Hydrogenophaga sp.]
MIAIVDYGLGNVQAIANIYRRLDLPCQLARQSSDLAVASHIVLPGVGAFDWAMTKLNESGMREALDNAVMIQKRPVLGICVGMQMLARRSDEGSAPGLGWLNAEVKRLDPGPEDAPLQLPHMGWNDVMPRSTDGLFAGFEPSPRFYFLHSYYFSPDDPVDALAESDYGATFTCAVRRGNVHGVQFHPEKSHAWGIQLLKNFANI